MDNYEPKCNLFDNFYCTFSTSSFFEVQSIVRKVKHADWWESYLLIQFSLYELCKEYIKSELFGFWSVLWLELLQKNASFCLCWELHELLFLTSHNDAVSTTNVVYGRNKLSRMEIYKDLERRKSKSILRYYQGWKFMNNFVNSML